MAKKKSRSGSRSRFSKSSRRSNTRVSKPKRVSRSNSNYLKGFNSLFLSAFREGKAKSLDQIFRDWMPFVRNMFSGFESSRGFDLNKIPHWTHQNIADAREHIAAARRLVSGSANEAHILVRARTAQERLALFERTGQAPLVPGHGLKRYVLYTTYPKRTRVRFVKERVAVGAFMGRPVYREVLRPEVRVRFKEGEKVYRDYFFREVLGFQPGVDSASAEGLRIGRMLGTFEPWQQMLIAMARLLELVPDRTPSGAEAWYQLLSDRGPVSVAHPKHAILDVMQIWGESYNSAMVETLIGLRYQSSEWSAQQEIDLTRARMKYNEGVKRLKRLVGRVDPKTGSLYAVKKKKPKKRKPKKSVSRKRSVTRKRKSSRKPRRGK